MLTTPNVLTLCRIATVPLIVYLMQFTGPGPSAAATAPAGADIADAQPSTRAAG